MSIRDKLAGMEDVELTLKSARVIRVMLEDPAHPRYGLEIMRLTGMGSGSMYPLLAKFTAAGWLTREQEKADPAGLGRPLRMLYKLSAEAVPVARAQLAAISNELGVTPT
jgi:DNA-binding PadR family transcriptional regulator